MPARPAHACTFGCGREYDYILVSYRDSETQFLCLPCFIQLATQMVTAMVEPDSVDVQEAVSEAGEPDYAESVPDTGEPADDEWVCADCKTRDPAQHKEGCVFG